MEESWYFCSKHALMRRRKTRILKKILIIDNVNQVLVQELERHGFSCDYFPEITRGEIEAVIDSYTGLILRSKIILGRDILFRAKNLQFIGRVGAGMENIDRQFCDTMGIRCFHSPEGNRDAVGEHTIGMLLSLVNHLNRADQEVRGGKWIREGNRGTEIKGKTIGIIGYGNMGSAFAQRLIGFEAEVVSYDKYKTGYSDGNTREATLDELFEKADIVSIHVPLTEETRYMCNCTFFNHFQKNIMFINTSRGGIVNTEELADMIRKGKVTGAALDVLEYENASFEELSENYPDALDFLLHSENILFTPHIAGWTVESDYKLARVLAEKIVQAFHGE